MENKVWINTETAYNQVSSNYRVEESLPVGIYNVCLTMNGFHLERYANEFVFPYKVYNLENDFIDHVIKTFNETSGNLGVLLTGTKGTGKTVVAKDLANKLKLPIIIVKDMDDSNQRMIEFLSSINCDCIFFLDEFEKNFDNHDSTVLQIMDGVYNSSFRRVFLLTTNVLDINDNLIGRPSRIRYIKEFGDLSLNIVNEYLDDNLKVPEAKEEILDFIDSLSISTIDILKSLVTEANIHGIEGFRRAKDFLNVTTNEYEYLAIRGYAYRIEVEQNPEKFTMRNFYNVARDFNKSIIEDEDYDRPDFNGLTQVYIYSDVKFKNLEIGYGFEGDEIVAIDEKLSIIVTMSSDKVRFYWIKNPERKPSLYSRNKTNFIL